MGYIIYLIILLILLIAEYSYYKFAKKIHLGAPVVARSSHKSFTPTGGGIIFIIASIIFAFANANALTGEWWILLGGVLALGIVSFIDDFHPLPAKPRLLLQFITVGLIFKQYLCLGTLNIYLIFLICGVGCINAYNFIDGINGILTFLAAVSIGSLIYAYAYFNPTDSELFINYGIIIFIALAVFSVFNLSNKIFAGDVGSIIIGLSIVWMLFNLIYKTHDATLIVLIVVCLFDTGVTLLQRITARENILQAHRKHIYQTLTNKWGIKHYRVSTMYALTQLAINAIYFATPSQWHFAYAIVVVILLSAIYISVRKSAKSSDFQS